MKDRIEQSLKAYFEETRIVFWYDDKAEFKTIFEELELPNIEKIILNNNEFAVKYHVLREKPKQKFLIYQASPKPDNSQNWLLDVLLSNFEFHAEQSSLCLAELNLSYEFSSITQDHPEFFKNKKRLEDLKKLIDPKEETKTKIQIKMLAVCVKSEASLDSILKNLFEEYSKGKEDGINLIKRCNLDKFLFHRMQIQYGYKSTEPTIKDFLLKLFNAAYKTELEDILKEEEKLNNDALSFIGEWKDSRNYSESFEKISDEIAEDLGIKNDLEKREYKTLINCDTYKYIDAKIIHGLIQDIKNRTIQKDECLTIISNRKQKRWFTLPAFENTYSALYFASLFINSLVDKMFQIDGVADGIRKYTTSWFKIDQYYRKYIYFINQSNQVSKLSELTSIIEKKYSNTYLLNLNDNWQVQLDKLQAWEFPKEVEQRYFFNNYVEPYLKKDKKVCVIISDALRFEIGDELATQIRQEDRFTAKTDKVIALLPSYTQLGMAALLPNNELKIKINEDKEAKNAPVMVDNMDATGIINRIKILQKYSDKITAMTSNDVLSKTTDELKAIYRDNNVIYIYHNIIDHQGHTDENKVFDATETAITELIKLATKMASANANNLIITSDHGFIYQNKKLEDTDFLSVKADGNILYDDVRYVIGRNLIDNSSLKKYTSNDIGLNCDYEFQFAKSINRLRKQGSKGQYVHGGLSLQEIIVPVIQINKKRESDTNNVEVSVLQGSRIISSNQIAVKFYQENTVNDKLQPRTLRIALYNKNNELISNIQEITFEYTSETPRDRETVIKIYLTKKADESNGQEVKLKLEEKIQGTSQYKEYKSVTYQIQKTFTTDFDF